MKTCTKCHETKPKTEFSKHARERDGLQSWCKLCSKKCTAAYRAANPDKVRICNSSYRASRPEVHRASTAKWAAANPEAHRIRDQNRRARERSNGGRLSPGLAAKLLTLQRGKCACCGVKLVANHLDHVIPVALGGPNEDWNMQLLCPPCNLSKGAKNAVEFMQSRGKLL